MKSIKLWLQLTKIHIGHILSKLIKYYLNIRPKKLGNKSANSFRI